MTKRSRDKALGCLYSGVAIIFIMYSIVTGMSFWFTFTFMFLLSVVLLTEVIRLVIHTRLRYHTRRLGIAKERLLIAETDRWLVGRWTKW